MDDVLEVQVMLPPQDERRCTDISREHTDDQFVTTLFYHWMARIIASGTPIDDHLATSSTLLATSGATLSLLQELGANIMLLRRRRRSG